MNDDDIKIETNKMLSEYEKLRQIKDCFYHNKEECRGKIKLAHSIQKNKRLSILTERIGENDVLYSFKDFESSSKHFIEKLIPIGKGKASTFFGFCDYHDTVIFSEIENKEFCDNEEHCFLHSYRSFAHSYHRKMEETKGNSQENPFSKENPEDFNREFLRGNLLAVNDLNLHKKSLDKWIEYREYDKLDYLSVILPELYPIACSSMISPFYTPKGKLFNYSINPDEPYSPVMLTVLPDFHQTIIIVACFGNDEKGVDLLDEIESLSDFHFRKFISTMMLYFAENTFFSPFIWETLGKKGQRLLCDEYEKSIIYGMTDDLSDFEYSKLNLLNPKFEYKKMKKQLLTFKRTR